MGGVFSKPKGPDPALIAAQQRQLDEERKRAQRLEEEAAARRRAIAGRNLGRVLLLGSGDERGVTTTLGGAPKT